MKFEERYPHLIALETRVGRHQAMAHMLILLVTITTFFIDKKNLSLVGFGG